MKTNMRKWMMAAILTSCGTMALTGCKHDLTVSLSYFF